MRFRAAGDHAPSRTVTATTIDTLMLLARVDGTTIAAADAESLDLGGRLVLRPDRMLVRTEGGWELWEVACPP